MCSCTYVLCLVHASHLNHASLVMTSLKGFPNQSSFNLAKEISKFSMEPAKILN